MENVLGTVALAHMVSEAAQGKELSDRLRTCEIWKCAYSQRDHMCYRRPPLVIYIVCLNRMCLLTCVSSLQHALEVRLVAQWDIESDRIGRLVQRSLNNCRHGFGSTVSVKRYQPDYAEGTADAE